MFLARLFRITLIAAVFATAYLPVSINPKIFERNPRGSVFNIATDNMATAIDY
jgi:hypothetical protein